MPGRIASCVSRRPMSMTQRRLAREALHRILALATVLSLGAFLPTAAHAGVSAGGAINPLPSVTTLGVGDQFDVTIRIFNTSQTTPPDAFQFLPATLTAGTSFVLAACQDSSCTMELRGTLAFVPVGGNGCVSSLASVTSCAADGANPTNKIDITIGSGIALPRFTDSPNFVDIAVVRLQAVTPVSGSGSFFLRGSTGPNQIS